MTKERDVWQERRDKALREGKLLVGDYVIDGSLTILGHEDQETLTLIPENDFTYTHIRWITRAGAFMWSLVAHVCKKQGGKTYRDEHFTMYRGTDGKKGKVGWFDAEFWGQMRGRRDMLSLQDVTVRDVEVDRVLRSPNGSKWFLTVDNDGNLNVRKALKGELHDDMELEG